MSEDLNLCLSLGEAQQYRADVCEISLRLATQRLEARTPTVAAALIEIPPPEWSVDLGSAVIGVSLGLALGIVAGAALTLASR